VRHDLDERDEGIGQPEYVPMTRGRVAALGMLLLAGAISLIGLIALRPWEQAGASTAIPPTMVRSGPIVLVSGRVDHGLPAVLAVPLYQAPEDATVVARVPDGLLARVLAQRGTWLKVQALQLPSAVGWVDDYYLRDRALRTDGGGQVLFVDAQVQAGKVLVAVRPVDQPAATPAWIPATLLREIGAK
jgi:hypothetical protein